MPSRRAKDIFLSALELGHDERAAFLREACGGDSDLERRARELLEAHEAAEDVLASAPGAAAGLRRDVAEGDRIGPYQIGRVLGEGGFGIVFHAEQETPVRREVAVKVLRVGMGSDQVIRRFEIERQALAMMDHPNIAQVFDAGTTEGGHPYFVMEYVDGLPITEYCARNDTSLRVRLELFRTVCLALQHAHNKGIVHRDIKPSNILVRTVDGTPVPKVIDFGIVKATEKSLMDAAVVTHEGLLIGTPAYMSPEQAGADPDVDTRSDVYSLGVLLYELLCGEPPFAGNDVRSLALVELQRLIREVDPPPPSRRQQELKTTASHSTTTRVQISPESDWIVMKCLEKDRARRYATANALAEDIGRFLRFEPIEAARPTVFYRLRKLVRRHRAASIVAVSLGLGLVLAAIGAGLGMVAARASARAAEEERAKVLRLSVFEQLEDLTDEQTALWPAEPAQVAALEDWLQRAEEVVDSLEGRADFALPGHRAQLAELRRRALPETPQEVQRAREAHPRFAEWDRLARKAAALRAAHEVRNGRAALVEVELDASFASLAASELNSAAWGRIDPARTEFGDEARGLALAQRALEVASPEEQSLIGDTLAWALFAVGRDAQALAASRAAVEAANEADRAEMESYLFDLEAAVERAATAEAAIAIEALEADARALDARIHAERELSFASEEDRWWFGELRQLVGEIEAFADPEHGVITGLSEEHGWGVQRRLDYARTIEERTVKSAGARRDWERAKQAVASDPRFESFELDVQIGLLPLGPDPTSGLQEFVHLQTGKAPERDAEGRLIRTDDTGLVFVLLPGGTFDMGAQATDPGGPNYDPLAQPDEAPVHAVSLGPFLISKFELTQGQWQRFAGNNPSRYDTSMDFLGRPITLSHPVEQVSWNEALRILARMSLDLPTEAQWEYAARAGSTSPWSDGPERDALSGAANLADQSAKRGGGRWPAVEEWPGFDDGYAAHAPVGSLRANAFGLHDTHGNVWEWCRDGYHDAFYGSGATRENGEAVHEPLDDPSGSRSRVNRGGGFATGATSARSSNRDPLKPDSVLGALGLRPTWPLRD